MAAIKESFGSGGANLTPGGSAGDPSLATAMRDVADDLAASQLTAVSAIDATDLAEALTLVNELKAIIDVQAAVTIKTTKV